MIKTSRGGRIGDIMPFGSTNLQTMPLAHAETAGLVSSSMSRSLFQMLSRLHSTLTTALHDQTAGEMTRQRKYPWPSSVIEH
ncbi:hypothetical protein N7455_001691 [Penicillium solitum]|uniref:uncharacterized protein n=1 Tax=Penicillium solitum TaxID=60172 RepID=UPI0017A91929|nr:hypothetical protein HAV15_005952 [Penicillium sp. str. \